jgi:hypothetical protein
MAAAPHAGPAGPKLPLDASEAVKSARELYASGRILEARSILEAALPAESESGSSAPTGNIGNAVFSDLLRRVRCEAERVEMALRTIVEENETGWTKASTSGDAQPVEGALQTYYKREGQTHFLRWEAVYDAEPHELLSVAREWDLMSKWNKYLSNTAILSEPTEMSVLACGDLWTPWPLANRSMQFECRGYDLLSPPEVTNVDPHLLILFESVDRKQLQEKVPGDGFAKQAALDMAEELRVGSSVDLRIYPSTAQLIPVKPPAQGAKKTPSDRESKRSKTRLSLTVVCDPQLPVVPEWLVNMALHVVSPAMHRMVQTILADLLGRSGVHANAEHLAREEGHKGENAGNGSGAGSAKVELAKGSQPSRILASSTSAGSVDESLGFTDAESVAQVTAEIQARLRRRSLYAKVKARVDAAA